MTAAHCLDKLPDGHRPQPRIFVGRENGAPKTSRESAAEATTYLDLDLSTETLSSQQSAKDVGLVWLKQPVLEQAIIIRPASATPTLSNQAMGVAGYSPFNKDGTENDTYAKFRTSAAFAATSVRREPQDSGEAVWIWTSTPTIGNQHGDSGGAFYLVGAGQQRNVIGLVSAGDTTANSYKQVDVTTPNIRDWLNTTLLDVNRMSSHSQANWYGRHNKLMTTMWYGEVDYTGPCQQGDSDCDHWYDIHDDCPNDYNPGQEEDPSGQGIACKTRSTLPFDPQNPIRSRKETILDSCTADSIACPVGACYFTDVTGQFWEHQGRSYDQPSYFGSYVRLDTTLHPPHYTLVQDFIPEISLRSGADEWYAPSDVKWECVAFRDIPTIPDPRACTLTPSHIRVTAPSNQTFVALPVNAFSVLSGMIGNIGFPGSPMPWVNVKNNLSGPNAIEQLRNGNLNASFTVESFSFSCGVNGADTPRVHSSHTVTATAQETSEVIFGFTQTAHKACWITGLGGAWGLNKASRTVRQPRAYIHERVDTGELLLTVIPGTLADGSKAPAQASSTCIVW